MSSENDLAFWFPRLVEAGIPVPRTEIVYADERKLWPMLDGEESPELEPLAERIASAVEKIGGYPCFLRTGQTSGKHYWNEMCHLPSVESIPQRIYNLSEFSACAGFLGLPFGTWVVRELLPVKPFFHAFQGMPMTRERRCFVNEGKLVCAHPYWPIETIQGASDEEIEILRLDNEEMKMPDLELIERAAALFEGAWSQDWLWTERGWMMIDMAIASDSFHWPGCPSVGS